MTNAELEACAAIKRIAEELHKLNENIENLTKMIGNIPIYRNNH